jgi:hypothetical protein
MKFNPGGQFENPPAGSVIGRCIQLIDLGTQQHQGFQGSAPWNSRDVRIVFELPEELMEGKYDPKLKGKPFAVSVTVKQSLHASAKLRKLLEGWAGKKFTAEKVAVFDPKKLLNQPARLSLIENNGFINIDGIAPLGKKDKCPKRVNPIVFFSLEEAEYDEAVFKKLGQKTQEKIQKSPEWAAISGDAPAAQDDAPPEGADDPPPEDNDPF